MQQAKSRGDAKKPKPKVQKAKSDPKLKKKFGSFFKRKVAPPPVVPNEPVNPEAPAPVPVAAANVPVGPAEPENPVGPQMLAEIVPGSKAKVFAKQLVDSIDVLTPQQLGIPVEGDEGFDEDTSYQLMDKIANDPMRYIYVSEVLNWWVNTLF